MTFHVGQKVTPVNLKVREGRFWFEPPPTIGAVYTVRAILFEYYEETIVLAEHPRSVSHWNGYASWRFRPIVEKKTDISFAHEILRKVTRKDRVKA